jgi:AraC-like DNA-binding protein
LQLIPRGTEALRLLLRYLKLFETSPKLRDAVAGHVHDLMALALTQHAPLGESKLGAVATARLNEALDQIAAHFLDPALSLMKVAGNMRISPRYVQRLLETSGTSFTEQVNELRLQRAYTLLTEARENKSRISDIALQVGFSDISNFNRLFRSRFGATPSDVRAEGNKDVDASSRSDDRQSVRLS